MIKILHYAGLPSCALPSRDSTIQREFRDGRIRRCLAARRPETPRATRDSRSALAGRLILIDLAAHVFN